jgi:hypothetical protein
MGGTQMMMMRKIKIKRKKMGPASSLVKRFPRPPVVRGEKKISGPQFHRRSANSPMAMARLALAPVHHRFSSQAAGLVPPAHRRRGESGWSMEDVCACCYLSPTPSPQVVHLH